jgi:MFS family permease
MSEFDNVPPAKPASRSIDEIRRLRDVSPWQWKAAIAAWLGWMFDGLDMHLYTLVALPFVAQLLHTSQQDPMVGRYSSIIQAAFLVGWALGGGFFGRIGDRIGRTRALTLTILTYAMFTGLSFFAQTWWHLFICRFLAALGIGGEWAVGASLLSETWPRRWRPWMAAVLQSSGNCGIFIAGLAYYLLVWVALPNRAIFLVGVLPALMVFWIRRSVPESGEWSNARSHLEQKPPGIAALFHKGIRRTTLLTIAVCSLSLTAHWALMFWYSQHLRNLAATQGCSVAQVNRLVSIALMLNMLGSIAGNFVAAWVSYRIGFRRAIAWGFIVYYCCMTACYGVPRSYQSLLVFLTLLGACAGCFALFTMYLPPLFPTLLRTTGAGLCYNIGRIVAALGTVFFGLFSQVGDYRIALLYAGFLFLPAAAVAYLLPEGPSPSHAD